MKYTYQGTEVELYLGKYSNGRKAIRLTYEEVPGEKWPFATATVNIPDEYCVVGEVFIKDYSENEGMLDFLIKNKIVEEPHRFVRSGYVRIPVCNLINQEL